MKKISLSLCIALIVILLVTTTGMAGAEAPYKIIAAQHDYIGDLYVSGNADGSLSMHIVMFPGYCVPDVKIHTSLTMDGIPQNKGGAIPGQFEYKYEFGSCVRDTWITIKDPAGAMGDQLYIAFHADVYGPKGYQETAWVVQCGNLAATQFPGKNWSAYFLFPQAW